MAQREYWGSQFGLILATIGSAVGIENVRPFPRCHSA